VLIIFKYAGLPEILIKEVVEKSVNGYRILIPIRFRVRRWFIGNRLLSKPPQGLSPFGKELL